MNSCIYKIKLGHQRLIPRKNFFKYSIYMVYFDLDELEEISRASLFFSYNNFNLLSFYDDDHFKFIENKINANEIIAKENTNYNKDRYKGKNTKERILTLVEELGIKYKIEKVYVLTNLRNFGYIFSPVSFYYCYDREANLRIMFSEVNNTFGDQKMYYTVIDKPEDEKYSSKQKKNYYISPFINYENDLEWVFSKPGKEIFMNIDSLCKGEIELKTSMKGSRAEIKKFSFLFVFLRYPMITFMTIFRIHYQALRLWFKKIKFYTKKETDIKIAQAIKDKK